MNASLRDYSKQDWTQTLIKQIREHEEHPVADVPAPEWLEQERQRCAGDIVYWVNTYCLTYDPREVDTNPTMPFILFPRQEEFLRWISERERNQESGLAEKSRDVGFTWLCCAYAVHGWLFRKGFSVGFGSRKLDLVDKKGDPKCIFEKLRFLVDHLPAWMLPEGYKPHVHSGFCKLMNPANGATITGEGGAQIGRGGRTSVYFVDEAAFLQHPKLADAALSANSRVKIWVSTPNGLGNTFYAKRFGGKLAVFTFRWMDDPRKCGYEVLTPKGLVIARGQGEPKLLPMGCRVRWPWYEQQKDELDEVTLAQEVDIDYTASVEGICIPAKWVLAAVNLPLKPSGFKTAGFDVAAGGKNKNVLIPRQGPVITEISAWGDMTVSQSAWRLVDECEERDVRCVSYDGSGIGITLAGIWAGGERKTRVARQGVLGGNPPSDEMWPNGKTGKEMFGNKRAELYWKMRTRFAKAYEYRLFLQGLPGGAWHPDDEMISIPNHATLIAELSTPLVVPQNSGKILIESKQDMRKRGVASPDHADALMYGEETYSDWAGAAQAATASVERNTSNVPEIW